MQLKLEFTQDSWSFALSQLICNRMFCLQKPINIQSEFKWQALAFWPRVHPKGGLSISMHLKDFGS